MEPEELDSRVMRPKAKQIPETAGKPPFSTVVVLPNRRRFTKRDFHFRGCLRLLELLNPNPGHSAS